MRLLVITTLLPGTEYQPLLSFCPLLSVCCSALSLQLSFSMIFSPPITLSQGNLMMANVTFALAKTLHLPHLQSPAMMFILLSSHRSSSFNPGRGNAMCSVCFADLRRRLWSLEFNTSHQTHESPALIYSAVGKLRLQRQVILEYNADGANKADGL